MYKAKPLAKVRLMDLSIYWTWLWARRNWILKKATDHRIGYYFWLNFEPTFQLLFHKYAVHTFCSFHNCDKINKKATKYSHYNEALKSFFKHLILTLSHLVRWCNKECFIWAQIVFLFSSLAAFKGQTAAVLVILLLLYSSRFEIFNKQKSSYMKKKHICTMYLYSTSLFRKKILWDWYVQYSLGRYLEGLLLQLCYALVDFYNFWTCGGLALLRHYSKFLSLRHF